MTKNTAVKLVVTAGIIFMSALFFLWTSYGNASVLREEPDEPADATYEKLDDPDLCAGDALTAPVHARTRDDALRSDTDGQQATDLPTVRVLRPADTVSAGTRFYGAGFHGETEIAGWEDVIQVAACGELFAGLKRDGTVPVADWDDIVRISVGSDFVVGLRADGTLVSAGIDGYGETHVDTPEWSGIATIDTGWQHTVGLDTDRNVHVAGYHSDALLAEIEERADEWTAIVEIATGGSTGSAQKGSGHIVGLKSDGMVVAVGDDSYGQCGVSGWKDVVAVSAGDCHTVRLTASGEVLTTQDPDQFPASCREIARWNEDLDTVAVSAGFGFTLRLKSDGTIEAARYKKDHQADVTDWASVRLPGSLPSPSAV